MIFKYSFGLSTRTIWIVAAPNTWKSSCNATTKSACSLLRAPFLRPVEPPVRNCPVLVSCFGFLSVIAFAAMELCFAR